MQDYLKDIVQHTNILDIESAKIINENNETLLEACANQRMVVLKARFKEPIEGLAGTFALPNLGKLNVLLNINEYKENAKITTNTREKNGETIICGLHFENQNGDFKNDYRFMTPEMFEENHKGVITFNGVSWNIELQPTITNVSRFSMQSQANNDETHFTAKTEGSDLKFFFGDESIHAGNFVFESNVTGSLDKGLSWPISHVKKILNLPGDITMKFSDKGVLMITVDSGLAVYDYILPSRNS